jgi:lactoylglutathione lyase
MKKGCLITLVFFSALLVYAQKPKAVLNHIAIYVTNLSKSTAFYQDIIGLDTIPEPFHDGKHTWFKVAEHSHLHLIQGAAGPSPLTKNSHLCFSVTSIEDVINGLKKNGVVYEDWGGKKASITLRVDGVHQIYFQDPDGYWIEINDDRY